MGSAREALARLREGNRRFVSNVRGSDAFLGAARRSELATGQEPFAIILGCSDSRVPAEIVFDQGLGDLFVIRVAGNVVAPSQVGSVEFAAGRFGTRLVVVLGHSQCGVILATLEELRRPTQNQSRNLRAIVDRVRPSVERLLATDLGSDPDALVRQAVRANIRASASHLRHGSQLLEQLIQDDGLLVVGAEYSLETGVVEFLDGTPEERAGPSFYEADGAQPGDPVAAVDRCIERGARALLFDRGALPPAFFDLSTGVAGALVQKLVNYQLRMAGVVPDLQVHSTRFQEFAREANAGAAFRFFATREEAVRWLDESAVA